MKQYGFYCFSLALLFALSSFSLQETKNTTTEKNSEATAIAFSIEQSNLVRFEIEQNSDKTIKQALENKQLETPAAIKKATDSALFTIFETEKKLHDIEIKFATASEKQYSQLAIAKTKPLEKKDIEANTKTLSVQIAGTKTIQYCFTGGIKKNKIAIAIIQNKLAKQFFILPINYCNQIIVINFA